MIAAGFGAPSAIWEGIRLQRKSPISDECSYATRDHFDSCSNARNVERFELQSDALVGSLSMCGNKTSVNMSKEIGQ